MGRDELKRSRTAVTDHDHDHEHDHKDLKLQKLHAELEDIKGKYHALSALRPSELLVLNNNSDGTLPMVITHHDLLLHYELDTLHRQNQQL
jgi:hypothetical protein